MLYQEHAMCLRELFQMPICLKTACCILVNAGVLMTGAVKAIIKLNQHQQIHQELNTN